MAAVCEPAPLSVSAHGVAFEVEIKSPKAAVVMTPVRERLEKQAEALPRLLCSSYDAVSQSGPESPVKERIAERARTQNQKKQDAVNRARRQHEELIDLKRTSLERDLERAAMNRGATLADKSSKAGKHFEEVKAKLGDVQRQHADATAERQRRLEQTLAMKDAARSIGVVERGSKAGQHNNRVADKVQKHQEELQRRLERLREQQQAAQRKADELREQFHRQSSAKGVAGRPVSAPATPSGKHGGVVGGGGVASMPATPSGSGIPSTRVGESSVGTP